jgi:hypothetical protein
MNSSELASKMLEWERIRKELDAIEASIKESVMELGKTQTVGNVTASYRSGTRSFDYQASCANVDGATLSKYATGRDIIDWDAVKLEAADVVSKFTITTFDYDYKGICKELSIEPIVTGQTEPSVSIKIK